MKNNKRPYLYKIQRRTIWDEQFLRIADSSRGKPNFGIYLASREEKLHGDLKDFYVG